MDALYVDEHDLLRKVAAGDRRAFNQLYTAHISVVYDYIYLFTKAKEETEEILQEVFVNIWEHREGLASVSSFRSYVLRAAKNRLINHIRHIKIKNRVLSEIGQRATGRQASPYDDITYKEYHRLIQEAVERLPPKRKAIFKIHIEEGTPYAEIAENFKISISVVKKEFYKACRFVRQYLYSEGDILLILTILPASIMVG